MGGRGAEGGIPLGRWLAMLEGATWDEAQLEQLLTSAAEAFSSSISATPLVVHAEAQLRRERDEADRRVSGLMDQIFTPRALSAAGGGGSGSGSGSGDGGGRDSLVAELERALAQRRQLDAAIIGLEQLPRDSA